MSALKKETATKVSSASIVICCYSDKRWAVLNQAILSAVEQIPPAKEIVVVVDHNPGLAERLIRHQITGVRVIQNREKRGLSGARNTGIAETTGDLLLFLDDDAVADRDMLAQLVVCCDRPYVLGAMAAIRPAWDGGKPQWFPAEFFWIIGCVYQGLKPGAVRNLIGAAMCVRRSVFEAVGGFNSGFGRNEIALPLGCEETELCIRALNAFPSGSFVFDPTSGCNHLVPKHRATIRYFVTRCWAEGLSKAGLSQATGTKKALASERAYTYQVLPRGFLNGLSDTFLQFRIDGVLRALAIVLGLFATAAGYGCGRLKLRVEATRGGALMDRLEQRRD